MERTLEDMLFSIQERDEHQVESLPVERTQECPSLAHFREALLDPSRWTEEERRHVYEQRCAPCQKTSQHLRQALWHPDRLDLLRTAFALPVSGQTSRYVTLHLDRDDCLRCTSVVAFMSRAAFLKPLAALLQGGAADAADRVRSAISLFLAPRSPVLLASSAPVQGWDTATPRPELFEQFSLGTGDITVTLQEDRGLQTASHTPQSLMLLTVETRIESLAGTTMRYTIMGTGNDGPQEVSGDVILGDVGLEGWISGTVVVGSLIEVQNQVGDDLVLMVYPPPSPS